MHVEVVKKLRGNTHRLWADLLESCGLDIRFEPETTVLVWDGEILAATGSRRENLLGCIAVSEDYQGQGLTATVLTQLRADAFAAGQNHLFVYTKPGNRQMFTSLFFYPVAQTDRVLLLESVPNGIAGFIDVLPKPCTSGNIGAAVMNCNPFTAGHRYLIEEASRECDWVYVFILSEDKSRFSAADRLEMAKLGTKDLPNVTVLPTGPYLISSATFPTYFLKGENTGAIQCMLDVEIFTKQFAPRFGITRRYVGTEPTCPVTAQYNEILAAELPKSGISLHQLQRLSLEGRAVSASAVRDLLNSGCPEKADKLLPQSTYQYLQEKNLLHKGG